MPDHPKKRKLQGLTREQRAAVRKQFLDILKVRKPKVYAKITRILSQLKGAK